MSWVEGCWTTKTSPAWADAGLTSVNVKVDPDAEPENCRPLRVPVRGVVLNCCHAVAM
jgi:hypothetical protein